MGQRSYYVSTFGCRVNQADSARIAETYDQEGWQRAQSPKNADVVVLNTCTVTHRSDADVRKAVARLRRQAPQAKVLVTGCFAQRAPQEAASLEGVHAVVGNRYKSRLPVISEALPSVVHDDIQAAPIEALSVEPTTTVLDKTRPFLKIQDGCDAHCTYCIIPSVRGPARGADPDLVASKLRALLDRGYFEVVLTGIHLGTYQFTSPKGETTDLVQLVRRLLSEKGLGRLRLSCIEPMAFPTELIELAARHPKLAPHFHLPLQSGSDRILKRMVRPYRAETYVDLMQSIKKRLPNACLGTDVIVGFPGETEADFQETLDTVQQAGIDYVHTFSYSHRSGTPATKLSGSVDPRTIKERTRQLIELSDALYRKYLDRQIGKTLPSVVLERNEQARALSENFCNIDLALAQGIKPGEAVDAYIMHRNGKRLHASLR